MASLSSTTTTSSSSDASPAGRLTPAEAAEAVTKARAYLERAAETDAPSTLREKAAAALASKLSSSSSSSAPDAAAAAGGEISSLLAHKGEGSPAMLLGSLLAAAADTLAPMWMDEAALARRSLRRAADEREAAAARASGSGFAQTRAPSPFRALAEAIEDGQQCSSSRVGGTGHLGSSLSASFFSSAVGDPTGTRARYDPLSSLAELEAPRPGPPPRADFGRGLLRALSEAPASSSSSPSGSSSSSSSSSSSPSPSRRTLGVLLDEPAPGPARFDFVRQLVLAAAEVAEERRKEAEERRRLRSSRGDSSAAGGGGGSSSSPRRRNKYDPIQYELDPRRKPNCFD